MKLYKKGLSLLRVFWSTDWDLLLCANEQSTANCAYLFPAYLLVTAMTLKFLQSTQAWKLEDSSLRTQFNKIQADM